MAWPNRDTTGSTTSAPAATGHDVTARSPARPDLRAYAARVTR